VLQVRPLARQLREALVSFDPAMLSGEDAGALAEELAATENAVAAARVRIAARAAEFGEHTKRGFATPQDWIARTVGASTREVGTDLATVAALEKCPLTKDALARGEVSMAQAAEIVRLPGFEAELLDVARNGNLAAVKRAAQRRRLEGIHPDDLAAEQRRSREVRHWSDELEMRRGMFVLTPEFGTRFANRLDAETDRVWREARRAGRSPTRSQCAADAFERLFEGKQRTNGRVPDLVFVFDLNAWARGHAHLGELGHIVGGGPCAVSAARRAAVDAFVKVVLTNGTKIDTVIHYGRRRPAVLQTVLDLGNAPAFDGVSCAEEGCDRRYGLQWDHKDPVGHHGPTSHANLQPLCVQHHVEKTARDRDEGLLGGTGEERGPPGDG
jgi:hypothetical protein